MMTRWRAVWSLKAVTAILGAVLIAGCAVPASASGTGSPGSGGAASASPASAASAASAASPASPASASGSGCTACHRLASLYPWLGDLALSELEDLIQQYGPDLLGLLVAAAAALAG